MTMRDESMKGTAGQTGSGTAADAVEQRVLAFAEQLGRIVGSVQAKAEGWLDRDALNAQISTVRDSASELLEHLAGGRQQTAASDAKGGSRTDSTAAGNTGSQTAAPKPALRDKQPSSSNRDKQASSANRAKQTARQAQAGGAKAQAGGAKKKPQGAKPAGNARSGNAGRSGGVVDAPGKRHRKAAPNQAMPKRTESPVAPIKMANANRSRGRG